MNRGGEDVEKNLRFGAGVEMPPLGDHLCIVLCSVHQVAGVREHDAKGRG
jgi:hypothetical protein